MTPEPLLQSIRTRPGLYLGGLEPNALLQCALSQVQAAAVSGRTRTARIEVGEHQVVKVWADQGLLDSSDPEVLLREIEYGPAALKPERRRPAPRVEPPFGLSPSQALSVIVALSSWAELQIAQWRARFENGRRIEASSAATDAPLTFQIDPSFFPEVRRLSAGVLVDAARVIAARSPGFELQLVDEQVWSDRFVAPNGWLDLLAHLSRGRTVLAEPLLVSGRCEDAEVTVGVLWTREPGCVVWSWANCIHTFAGRHLEALPRAIAAGILPSQQRYHSNPGQNPLQ